MHTKVRNDHLYLNILETLCIKFELYTEWIQLISKLNHKQNWYSLNQIWTQKEYKLFVSNLNLIQNCSSWYQFCTQTECKCYVSKLNHKQNWYSWNQICTQTEWKLLVSNLNILHKKIIDITFITSKLQFSINFIRKNEVRNNFFSLI